MNSLVGRTLGPYRIDALLGRGGMGEVFRAYQSSLDRDVAIKVLYTTMLADAAMEARFRQEAQAAARLRHPNIVQVYDFGEADGIFYMVMELLEGQTLREELRRRSARSLVSLEDAVAIVTRIADALDYAHARGVLHRDIKPDNIMLVGLSPQTTDQTLALNNVRVVLTDFGLAKLTDSASLTRTGQMAGTPAYMSPEQCQGQPVDLRADVYALGVVLYELLTGQAPFNADSSPIVIYQQIHAPPPSPSSLRPDLPQALVEVLLCALAKRPADRYASAGALARDVELALRAGPTSAFVPTKSLPSHAAPSPAPTPPQIATPPASVIPTAPESQPDAPSSLPVWAPLTRGAQGRYGALQVALAEGGQRLVRLDQLALSIGRGHENDLQLGGSRTSRLHARITCGPDGCRVEDLGSTNGTYIGSERLFPNLARKLADGDIISIGDHRLHFVTPQESGAARQSSRPARGRGANGVYPAGGPTNASAYNSYDATLQSRPAAAQLLNADLTPQRISTDHRGAFRLTLTNMGNDPMTISLQGADDAGALQFKLPLATVLKPGEKKSIKVRVKGRRSLVNDTQQPIPFTITAYGADSRSRPLTTTVHGEMIIHGSLSTWLATGLLLIALIAALSIGLYVFAYDLLPIDWATNVRAFFDALLGRIGIPRAGVALPGGSA
jgi:serine/threonine protein kinase